MAIDVKATFNYSATAATAAGVPWSLTASTSIAATDILVLVASYRHSATSTGDRIASIADNAGNVWTRVIGRAADTAGDISAEMWYAPVTTTTANYQVALSFTSASYSARAAHLLVLSGNNLALNAQTVAGKAIANTIVPTQTLSTSLAALDNDLLVGVFATNNNASTSATADVAWTRAGVAVGATGGQQVKHHTWYRVVSPGGVYALSVSANAGGTNRRSVMLIAGFSEVAAVNSISGATDIAFGVAGTLAGTARTLSGAATVAFSPVGTLVGSAATLSGAAAVAFNAAGSLAGTNAIAGSVPVTFSPAGNLAGTAATLSGQAAVTFAPTGTLAGSAAALSGDAAVTFAPVGTLAGAAATLSGAAQVTFAPAGNLVNAGSPSISGVADITFSPAATITGSAATLSGASNVVFGVFGNLTDIGGGVTATASTAPQTSYGGWDPRAFRKLLAERRRENLERARRLLAEVREPTATQSASVTTATVPAYVKSVVQREASVVAQRLLALNIASARQAWKLKEQEVQISALRQRLDALAAVIAEDEDDEDFLMMVA